MKLSTAQPGPNAQEQWPSHLLVQYGPVSNDDRTTSKTYDVYVDNYPAGKVKIAKVRPPGTPVTSRRVLRWTFTSTLDFDPLASSFRSKAEVTAALVLCHLSAQGNG